MCIPDWEQVPSRRGEPRAGAGAPPRGPPVPRGEPGGAGAERTVPTAPAGPRAAAGRGMQRRRPRRDRTKLRARRALPEWHQAEARPSPAHAPERARPARTPALPTLPAAPGPSRPSGRQHRARRAPPQYLSHVPRLGVGMPWARRTAARSPRAPALTRPSPSAPRRLRSASARQDASARPSPAGAGPPGS